MNLILLTVLIPFLVFPKQDSIDVRVLYNETDMVVRTFELALLKKVVSIYNSKKSPKLKIRYEIRNKPNEIWYYLNDKTKKDKYGYVCGLISASITQNDPNYDFSYPYLPTQDVLIARVDDENPRKNKPFRLVHMASDYYLPIVDSLSKIYKMTVITKKSYTDAVNYFLEGKADYYLGDSIDSWVFQNRKVALLLNKRITYLGILYPNNSKLKPLLDDIIMYFTKSPAFYRMLKHYFGKDLKKYYKETMNY